MAGIYIDRFGIKEIISEVRFDKKVQQKAILRKLDLLFTVLRHLGIVEKFSKKTVKINKDVFENFTLQEVLKYRLGDFYKQ